MRPDGHSAFRQIWPFYSGFRRALRLFGPFCRFCLFFALSSGFTAASFLGANHDGEFFLGSASHARHTG